MPDAFSMTAVLIIFYAVFASQIFVLSVYYPAKLIGRVEYVLKHFPPADYPKLYPSDHTGLLKSSGSTLRIYRAVNYVIATIGFMILSAMMASGYRPAEEGGDEIFVMFYFFLQAIPFTYVGIAEYNQFKKMRETFQSSTRVAELKPRRLFDFISPVWVAAAVIFFVVWLVFYLTSVNAKEAWEIENYITLLMIVGMNIVYFVMIAVHMKGKKLDPYKAHKDQLKQIEATVKTLVFSSIMVSMFLIVMQAADQYALEVFDPAVTSFYLQLCVIFGFGLTLNLQKIEATDFEVYKDNEAGEVT